MTASRGNGAGAGQVIAMGVVLLFSLPILPLVLLFILAVRLRDWRQTRRERRETASELASKPASN